MRGMSDSMRIDFQAGIEAVRVELYVPKGMVMLMDERELNEAIETLCRSKAEEFHLLGYEHVTAKEIWQCVSDRYKTGEDPPLYRIVNDILSLKVTGFMNYLTLSAFKGTAF